MNPPVPRPGKCRLDQLLVTRGMFESRERAQRAILAGGVFVNGQRADKAGSQVTEDCQVDVRQKERYVSRGGTKLEVALTQFAIDPTGLVCMDVGASTGGFTDCLLQHGAARVYALDVGHGQLDWKIRSDPRVIVREKLNVRYLTQADLPEAISLAVIDVSFISLTLILPAIAPIITDLSAIAPIITVSPEIEPPRSKIIVALIKPQFELGRSDVGRGGIVRDAALHERAIEKIRQYTLTHLPNWRWTGLIDSPILGTEGNKEFLACLRN